MLVILGTKDEDCRLHRVHVSLWPAERNPVKFLFLIRKRPDESVGGKPYFANPKSSRGLAAPVTRPRPTCSIGTSGQRRDCTSLSGALSEDREIQGTEASERNLPKPISHPCTVSCEFARQTATSAPFILCRDWPILSVLAGVVSKEGMFQEIFGCIEILFSHSGN